MIDFSNEINNVFNNSRADISVLLVNMDTKEKYFQFEPRKKVVSASTIKVAIMLCVLQSVLEGKHSLDEKIFVKNEDILDDSMNFEQGEGYVSIDELIHFMIITSDNTSTNALITLMGMDTINEYAKKVLGCENTVVMRKMLDFKAIDEGRNNYISANDLYLMFDKMYYKTILNSELCDYAIKTLKGQRGKELFMRYIYENLEVAHKLGGLDFLKHDAGIFYLENIRYFLAVMVQNAQSDNEADRIVAKISKIVYNSLRA